MKNDGEVSENIRVLLADFKPMENQLLAGALRRHGFDVVASDGEVTSILNLLETALADVVVISCTGPQIGLSDMAAVRTLHFSNPDVPKIMLLDSEDRETVLQAFHLGARGLFCLADASFQSFCECIARVARGEVWASTRQLNFLLESVCQVPCLRITGAGGESLLTSREEQVVALVADGLSNRHIATELGLSEHTIKKYLFRIFEKLGISNRVELVLYAVHHGTPQPAEWIARA
jgi:DNA-binding NarL/FixJ family response regulator